MYIRIARIFLACIALAVALPSFSQACSPVIQTYDVAFNPATYGNDTDAATYNAVLSQARADVALGSVTNGACVRARFQNGTFQYFRVNVVNGTIDSLTQLSAPTINTNGSSESCGMMNDRSGGLSGYIQTAWICYGDGTCVMVDYMFKSLPYYDTTYGGTTLCGTILI